MPVEQGGPRAMAVSLPTATFANLPPGPPWALLAPWAPQGPPGPWRSHCLRHPRLGGVAVPVRPDVLFFFLHVYLLGFFIAVHNPSHILLAIPSPS